MKILFDSDLQVRPTPEGDDTRSPEKKSPAAYRTSHFGYTD